MNTRHTVVQTFFITNFGKYLIDCVNAFDIHKFVAKKHLFRICLNSAGMLLTNNLFVNSPNFFSRISNSCLTIYVYNSSIVVLRTY